MSYKKYWLLLCLAACMSPAYADVLVILPESGTMARAGQSIKRGFLSAYTASGSKEKIIFVDSAKNSIDSIFKKKVTNKTRLIVGPLARPEIENVIQLSPKIPVLALNDVNTQAANVWQYSLAKQDDAVALNQLLKKDGVKKLFVLRQTGTESATELFLVALVAEFGSDIEMVNQLPKKLSRKEGVLLLGDHQWMEQLGSLPEKNIYATPLSIEQGQPIPIGLSFCDVPALYNGQWADLIEAYKEQPENMAFQRLLAFGGDAWSMSQQFLEQTGQVQFSFVGRTGAIELKEALLHKPSIKSLFSNIISK
ncbi:penicillin-binding protein activator [Acinetobacter corruptisaponis]|uniref:Penicillin-binding protein activator n=1 Tax=Acinetobacter corruptisaponis TaxID=3045147 RepID=A0ABY8S8T5_9GAMM|nr:penicillin-binding protein activator [Acinetobacter sp. KCTC 92772]WHP06907.1 penicillin-binding protein activator [Acinetobacter sp. KCTC 92772]